MDARGHIKLLRVRDTIIDAIHDSRNSILRAVHSGDKVARLLDNLLEALHETRVWYCDKCQLLRSGACDHPGEEPDVSVCPICGSQLTLTQPDKHIFETDAYKEAEAYMARIRKIRETKKDD